jgi:hypothetical protein
LIIFGAQNVNVVPAKEFPALVEKAFRRKVLHDFRGRRWLLFWTCHFAFMGLSGLVGELKPYIFEYMDTHKIGYERIFLLGCFMPRGYVIEFYKSK